MVKHFGVFLFKEDFTEKDIDDVFKKMETMVGTIPGLLDFNYGPYNSSEGLNQGYTHGFIMTFDSVESRDIYLDHKYHDEVKDFVVPKLEQVLVFDFKM